MGSKAHLPLDVAGKSAKCMIGFSGVCVNLASYGSSKSSLNGKVAGFALRFAVVPVSDTGDSLSTSYCSRTRRRSLPRFALFVFVLICHSSLLSFRFRQVLQVITLDELAERDESSSTARSPALPRHHRETAVQYTPDRSSLRRGPTKQREAGFSRKPSFLRSHCWLT